MRSRSVPGNAAPARPLFGGALCLALLLGPAAGIALALPRARGAPQEKQKPSAEAPPSGTAPAATAGAEEPEEGHLDREVPRGAVAGYLEACRNGDFKEAATYLDLGFLPEAERESRGPVLARHFKVVLDRTLWVDLEKLSPDPEGDTEDGLPPGVDRVGAVPTAKGSVDVLVKRVPGPSGKLVWEFSRSTLRRVPALYGQYGYGALGEVLPEWFFQIRFLEVELWQWIGLLLLAVVAWYAALLLTWIIQALLRPLVRRTRTELDDRIVSLLSSPARLGIALLLFTVGTLLLKLSVPVHRFLHGLEKGLTVVVVTWILMRLVHVGTDLLTERLERRQQRSVIAMMPLARKSLKVVLMAMAAIGLLQSVGFNVTGIVAGLGVGGLAVALAAQKTVENLFGGVTLAADQPVRVGDFCKWGSQVGTVEDVGLRSTRIRTLDRTLVTVPNSVFSQMELENFSRRDKIRLYTVIGVRYETSPDQLRHVLAEVRKLLAAHPKVDADPARIRFVGFGSSSLDLEIFAYILTQDFNEFLKVREDIFLRLMDIVEASGTSFAFPSQTLYLGRDSGLPPEKTRAAEEAVRLWREKGELPFPDFSPEAIQRIQNTLDYPPRGSATAPPEDPAPRGSR